MTSFATLETSREDGRPLEIYDFVLGGTTYRYTSAEDEITVGGAVYTPKSLARSAISKTGQDRSRPLIVTLPSSDPLPQLYREVVPGDKCSLSVYRLQRDELPTFNTVRLMFKGLVQSVKFSQDGYTADLNVKSIEDALNRNLPRFTYQSGCNHILYDDRCQAAAASFNVVGAVASGGDTTVVTVTGANAQPDGYWTGGYAARVSGGNDFRLILAHSGNDLTLLLPFSVDVTGTNLQVFAGCDHIVTGDCATKFNNVVNFGGFGFVPNRNPFADDVF